ncbi:T9SS type A sorting domain-containing protein [Flavobacterium sp. FlaQc-48]|uniref:T9SS type A sorting domain-containing protein n=1 Tax=Flavobacterium sp. FlaQc-48 TaxID=3374181 RepID=UPI0037568EFB
MRKFSFYLALIIIMSVSVSAQTVTLTPTSVNGNSFSGGAINLGGVSYSSISLSVKVEIPGNVAVGDQGTIKIYCSNSAALGANVTIGGDGGSLYFGGGKVATKSFNINLIWGDFLTSSGYIFAEYRNPAGTAYKSSNIAVIKNATLNGGTVNPPADAPNPTQIANTLCCNQTIRQGEKPTPITGSQYNNPYKNEIYGINSQWTATNGSILDLDNTNKTLYLDYTSELNNITIKRNLGYNGNSDFPNKSNTITITVVPSPIIENKISISAPINSNGFFEIIDTNPKQINGTAPEGKVNLNILQDPFHIQQRGDITTSIERYEWEYQKTKPTSGPSQWITINNANSSNLDSFTPSNITQNEDNYYLVRRIAIYKNLRSVSNTLKIIIRSIRNNNTICCNQILMISLSNEIDLPNLITGSTAVASSNQPFTYRWQSQSIDYNNGNALSNWSNIPGATDKDYSPPPLILVSSNRRQETTWSTPVTYNYRRLTIPQFSNEEISYSNEINLSSASYKSAEPRFIIYPNPATSIINIENKNTTASLSETTISIVNIMGVEVNSNNFSTINPNLINIDISNLIPGTYFINIETFNGGRRNTKQFTFIKSN